MNDTALHFAQPVWIAAGAVACLLVAALWFRFDRRRNADLAKLIHPRFHQKLTEGFSPRLRMLKRALWLAALFLAFLAVARPQKGYEWREVKRKGIDILFAVDTSRSMLAEDLSPNRLERARLGILDFVAKLQGDRVGLIPFAGSSFALCPLTLDYEAFRESLNALDTDLIPKQGTDLASAIKEAERLFDEAQNNHRVLVLMTDGEDLQGSALEAAKEAGKKGMAIYTIGVGSPEGGKIPIDLGYGRKDYVRDANGKVVHTTLDESTLKQIAETTGAMYVPLGRGAEGLQTIYQERLRLVPKSEMDQRMERIPLERFEWPLGAAIILLLVEFFIPDRLRAKKARPLPSAARLNRPATLLGMALLSLHAAPGSDAAEASSSSKAGDPRLVYNQGTEAYTKGDFAKAADSLNASLKTEDLALQQKSYYNLGNTLYRTGQGTLEKDPETTIKTWEKAIKAYQDALALDAKDEDAGYNAELVKKKLEELKKQQNKDDKKDDKKDDQKQDKDDKKDQKDKQDQKDKKDGDKDQKDGQDQNKEGEDGKKPGDKDQEKKDGSQKDQDSKDGKDSKEQQDSKDGQKPGDEKKPGEEKDGKEGEKEGDPKDSKQEGKEGDASKDGKDPKDPGKEGEKQEGTMSEARGERQEMSAEEAKQLLEALRQDERTVVPIPQPQRRSRYVTPENSTKGKTW